MGSLTGCLSKAGKNISREDKAEIIARSKALRDDGELIPTADLMAVEALIASIEGAPPPPPPRRALDSAAPRPSGALPYVRPIPGLSFSSIND